MIETRFKNSEVGLIPEDWELKLFEDICSTKSGGTPSREVKEFYSGNIPWVTTGELNDGYIYDTTEHISEAALVNSSAKVFPAGTLLMAMYGATIGKLGITKVDTATNQACCAIFLKNDEQKYVFYKLLFDRPQLVAKGYGAGQPNISQAVIKKLQYAFPSKTEQSRIAEALSDVDDLIAITKKLIEKKRNIKEGAMQELLSGKRRLRGFKEKWVEVLFKDIYKYASEGGTPDTSKTEYYNMGNLPFVKIEDTANKYIDSVSSYITQEGLKNSSAWLIPSNNIIFTNGATVGNVAINRIPVTTKQGILGVLLKDVYDLEFVYYILSFSPFQNEVHNRESGGTFATIILKNLDTIPLCLPCSKDEQSAIAQVLSDMDSEIQSLEVRLTKYQSMKQGMMQQLLTGKIRLI